jgi:hypothetical protein
MQKSNEWAFTMELKKHVTDLQTVTEVLYACKTVISKINRLITDITKSKNFDKADLDFSVTLLEASKNNFEHIRKTTYDLCSKDDIRFTSMDFYMDRVEKFNLCIARLERIGKNKIQNKSQKKLFKLINIS